MISAVAREDTIQVASFLALMFATGLFNIHAICPLRDHIGRLQARRGLIKYGL